MVHSSKGGALTCTLTSTALATAREASQLICMLALIVSIGGKEMNPGDAAVLQTMFMSWSLNTTALVSCDVTNSAVLCDNPDGHVTSIDLYGRGIAGAIPLSIGELRSLTVLDLSNNTISGSIPDSIGNITSLNRLVLSNNKLTGGIPSSLGKLSTLRELDLSYNQLSGPLPATMANLTDLMFLSLNSNKLNGTISPSIASSMDLLNLNLTDNYFTNYPINWERNFTQTSITLNCLVGADSVNQRPKAQCPATPPPPQLAPSQSPRTSPTIQGSTAPPPRASASRGRKVLAIALAVSAAGAILCLALLLCCVITQRKKRKAMLGVNGQHLAGKGEMAEVQELDLPSYTLARLREMTQDWSEANVIGRGGYGVVYKGLDGTENVAVKRLIPASEPPTSSGKEFANEVRILSQVRHKNLVQIRGFCCHQTERIFVMDYVEGSSLAEILFKPRSSSSSSSSSNISLARSQPLNWAMRHKIALGTCEALHYLHSLAIPGTAVLHRDIKADNILLDAHCNPLVCDFGVSRITHQVTGKTHTLTGNLKGTLGYIAPECLVYGQVSTKSDVYSFGVILIELVTGTRQTAASQLDTASTANGDRLRPLEAAVLGCTSHPSLLPQLLDPILQPDVTVEVILPTLRVALHCVLFEARQRPSMETVLAMLQGQMEIPPLPNEWSAWTRWTELHSQSVPGDVPSGSRSGIDSDDTQQRSDDTCLDLTHTLSI